MACLAEFQIGIEIEKMYRCDKNSSFRVYTGDGQTFAVNQSLIRDLPFAGCEH